MQSQFVHLDNKIFNKAAILAVTVDGPEITLHFNVESIGSHFCYCSSESADKQIYYSYSFLSEEKARRWLELNF